jgi:signal transduction histidine kinase/ligand-binding sensor domain-containing protein/DNA-binding response OmpR family regulator
LATRLAHLKNPGLIITFNIISPHSAHRLRNRHLIISLAMLLFFFFMPHYATGQIPYENQKLKFEVLSTKDGLPSNWVDAILQDSQGFMWFGASHGLARYDGYEFRDFGGNPLDTNSIGVSAVWDIVEDMDNSLWLASDNGLFRLDRNTGKLKRIFNRYVSELYNADSVLWIGYGQRLIRFNKQNQAFKIFTYDPDDSTSFIGGYVRVIFQDRDGAIWIGTEFGLCRFNETTETFTRLGGQGKFQYNDNEVIDAYVDENGVIWLLSRFELTRFDPLARTVKKYQSKLSNLAGGAQWTLCEGIDGYLWIGSRRGDVNIFNPKTERFARVQPDPNDPHSLPENNIPKIYRDKSGNLWFGAGFNGVAKLAARPTPFKQYDLGDTYNVSAIAEDSSGSLFIGTWGNYVLREKRSGGFRKLPIPGGSGIWIIHILYADRKGTLWGSVGTYLIRFDAMNYSPKFVRSRTEIAAIFEDSAHRLWVGNYGPPWSLGLFDRRNESFRYLDTDSTFGKIQGYIKAFLEDAQGRLWIGSNTGLYRIDNIREWGGESNPNLNIVHYHNNPDDTTSLSFNSVLCLYEDRRGDIWVGTGVGLNKFDSEGKGFSRFFIADGLPSNIIRKILEDNQGNLWLNTPVALCKVNLSGESPQFRTYDVSRGLSTNLGDGFHKRHSGEIMVGTVKGLVGFFPDSLRDNPHIPPVAITDFKVSNKSLQFDTTISRKRHIMLSHDRNFFSLEFAALEFTAPERNQYAYIMEGLETDWNYIGTRRFANYTNVAPGSYVFRVKASNNDGVWNEEGTTLRITIFPPWWQTWWAYSIYALLILGTLYGLRRYELSRQRLKYNLKLEQVEADKLHELDKMKSRFFANISHEFRTPLTLIKGPIERWLPKMGKPEMKQDFEMTQRNTNRLLRLVNQLLDIPRLESGKMKLQARPENVVELTRQLTMAFESLASVNDIELEFTGPDEPITVYLDREQYEKIITNLLFNALKFTPEGGEVIVNINPSLPPLNEVALRGIEIKVTDTGIGIPADHVPHIFDRFYQVEDSYAKDSQGSGIGLALTKELVELHHGEISVESEVGQGTEFTIRLPLGKEHLTPEEIVESKPPEGYREFEVLDSHIIKVPEEREDSLISKSSGGSKTPPMLLIVEDNPDMRTYIRELLVQSYEIVEATNGQEGLDKAAEIIPDIIISDVMMPEMDGFQFCEKIKTDERTSHIPVILLTAKSSGESKIEGLETGADDYLIKPFDSTELIIRVKNLIEQRRKLRERFGREITLEPKNIAITSADGRFLQKMMDVIEENIEATDFGVEELSDKVGMSRSQLFRKVKALTDQSPFEFIRTVKLKRATVLLENHTGNISEIAYQVGFNNPAYFAECFRKLFGVSPKEFVSQSKE